MLLVRVGPRLTKLGSMTIRRLQGGNVQYYAGWIALGVGVILYIALR